MNIEIAQAEHLFNSLLQKEISISLDGKVLKEGKLILFSIKTFYLNFKFKSKLNSEKMPIMELPFPFRVTNKCGSIILSYRIDDFINKNIDMDCALSMCMPQKPSKLLNSEVKIRVIKGVE